MKRQSKRTLFFLLAAILTIGVLSFTHRQAGDQKPKTMTLKTYLIERNIPGAGKLTPADLKGISQASCSILKDMKPRIEWVHSYVTGDAVYCIYKAENEELVREHAKRGNFPANRIIEVSSIISPATAE